MNLFVMFAALHSVSSLEGLSESWSELATFSDGLEVWSTMGSGVFVASGLRSAPRKVTQRRGKRPTAREVDAGADGG